MLFRSGTNVAKQAAVAQSVERRIGSAEVTGPIPVASLTRKKAVTLDCTDPQKLDLKI